MDIIRLPDGERAAKNVDCIHVEETQSGKFDLTGSALANRPGEDDVAESVAIVGGAIYDSEDEAERAGIAWATEQGVATLYISHGVAGE